MTQDLPLGGRLTPLQLLAFLPCPPKIEQDRAWARWLTGSTVLLSGLLFFLWVPPRLFSHMEGWRYMDSFYFTLIKLSTLGFGDYMIGEGGTVGLSYLHLLGLGILWCP
ncbi:hypothetical protein A6R68_09122, partial [Neotoma lepida]